MSASRDIVVIGTSAGGVEALQTVARGLPEDFPAAVFVVMHLSASSISMLAHIIGRAGPLKAVDAEDGQPIERGTITVARPDFHLLLETEHIHVVHGPKENHFRPAVDPLFRSAALVYGPRTIGVVLTGTLDDGAAGLYDVKRRGGVAVVQDPDDAAFPGMPQNALRSVKADHVLPLSRIAPVLARLVRQPAASEKRYPVPEGMQLEASIATLEGNTVDNLNRIGSPSGFACPECYGPLWRLDGVDIPRFRCHVGHAYSPESLLEAQSEVTEASLYRVLQANDERIQLMREMARRAKEDRFERAATRWEDQIQRLERLSRLIKLDLAAGGGESPKPGKNGVRGAHGNGKAPARRSKGTS